MIARLWKNNILYYHHDGWKRHWLQRPVRLGLEIGHSSPDLRLAWGYGWVEGVQLHAGFGWGFWLTLRLPYPLMRRIPRWPKNEREVGIGWYAGVMRLRLGHDPNGSPVYNNCVKLWNFEWLVGRYRHEHRILMPPQRTTIEIGWWKGDSYEVDISLEERRWTNRIHSFRRIYYEMNVPDGFRAPPFPGKGENSWDCGDDGLYGSSVNIDGVERSSVTTSWKLGDPRPKEECSLDAARKHFSSVVEKYRLRYGSRRWRPDYLNEPEPERVI